MARYAFDNKASFVAKLEELVRAGVPKDKIDVFTPYHVHETDHLLDVGRSSVRFFTALGAVTGLVTGFAFTIGTVMDWPMITGGKPYVSIPAFLVIAYELTILFGVLASFVGFLHLARSPVIENLFSEKPEFSRQFVIEVND